MRTPENNWIDGSMKVVATSVGKYQGEHYFLKSVLDALVNVYWGIGIDSSPVTLVYLPVTNAGSAGVTPDDEHSALLEPESWFTPPGLNSIYVVCRYKSKWADRGLFEHHRWGNGHIPPEFLKGTLTIYAPKNGWNPPYFSFPTPWGNPYP